ncbi:hypothetical protein D3C80_913150 [compost metagenome]
MNPFKIAWIVWIDQGAHASEHVTGSRFDFVEGVRPGAILSGCVVILADDLQRHEARSRIRQRNGDGTSIEIENTGRIQRIPVAPDHRLMCDWQ